MKVAAFVLACVLCWPLQAQAAQVPCWIIEAYVKSYGGEEAATKAAKEHGWTDADIAKAKKRCAK